MTMIVEDKPQRVLTVDELLQQKRASVKQAKPSDGFWDNSFAPKFARKMMAALSRPKPTGRALTVAGWVTPVVVTVLFAVTLAIAYFFSPQRAIARWEAAVAGKQYVVDAMKNDSANGKPYAIQHSQDQMKAEPSGGVASYRFSEGKSGASDF